MTCMWMKCLGEVAVTFLTGLFNKILKNDRIPEEKRTVLANLRTNETFKVVETRG